jgi:hypothetical protein
MRFAGDAEVSRTTLWIKNVAIYSYEGDLAGTLRTRSMLQMLGNFVLGYTALKITEIRYGEAVPGKLVGITKSLVK